MKVWITKYALTDGIVIGETHTKPREGMRWEVVFFENEIDGCSCGNFLIGGNECFTDKEFAIKRAKEMRQKKIESLKKQIKKLEEMRFE